MSVALTIEKMHGRKCVYVCYKVFFIKEVLDWRVLTAIGSHANNYTICNHAVNNGDLFVCTAFIYSPVGSVRHLT